MGRVSTRQNGGGEGDFEKRWLECGDITSEGELRKKLRVTWKEALILLTGNEKLLKICEQRAVTKSIYGGSSPQQGLPCRRNPRAGYV